MATPCPHRLFSSSFDSRSSSSISSTSTTTTTTNFHLLPLLLPPLLFCLLLLLCLPSESSAYFVLARYSELPPAGVDDLPLEDARVWLQQQAQAMPSSSFDELAAMDKLDDGDDDDEVKQWMHPAKWHEALMASAAVVAAADSMMKPTTKRSANTAKTLAGHEHVCKTIIRTDFRPTHGHEQNGTRVEIQQDERRQFTATFVECENTKREHCHGIDNAMFSSECVTVYEFRPAGVRMEGSSDEFVEGVVKVPITCQCRLRRKIGNGLLRIQ